VSGCVACGSRSPLDATGTNGRAADAGQPPRVAFFGDGGAHDENALSRFLREYPAIVARRSFDVAAIDAPALADFDLVILDQPTRTFRPDEADALERWVRSGGSLMSLVGFRTDQSDRPLQNSLLAKLRIAYQPGLIFNGPEVGHVTDFAVHPLAAGLTSVPFYGGYHIAPTNPAPLRWGRVAGGEGGDVGLWLEDGAGRVYAWGDEWVEYSSEWTSTDDTERFWSNAMGWLLRKPQ
jgi:hypothetical protein